MRHADARLGRGLQHALNGVVDGLHAVGHVVDLAAAADLQTNGRAHHIGVVLAHVHRHGATAGGRRGDEAHIAHAAHGHLHRARDGRRGEREHVDLLAHVLELLLVLHAETLLLVDDHQAELMRVDVGGEQAVGADEHVDAPLGEGRERAALLRGGTEAR